MESSTLIDYILWDADNNGRMEAIGVYNVLEEKYDYYLIEHDLAADDLLEYQVQLEDIGFPAFSILARFQKPSIKIKRSSRH